MPHKRTEEDDLLTIIDADNDILRLQHEYGDEGKRLFIECASNGAWLTPKDAKALRKAINRWLIDHGHKEAH